MKKIQFNSLKSRITITITGILVVSLLFTTFFFASSAKRELSNAIEANALNLLEATKNHVESQHNSILYHKTFVLERRKNELKNNIAVLLTMINRAYKLYETGQLNEYEAKQRAITAIQQARYDNNVGYFWINNTEQPIPRIILHPTMPHLEGTIQNSSKYDSALGKNINLYKAQLDICLEHEEGFLDYLWEKPTSEGLTEQKQLKISYVKLFKPWNWIVGNGVYYDDIEKDVQNRINAVLDDLNKTINKQRIGESGYFFIFNEKGLVLVHPSSTSDSSSHLINPITGDLLYEELKAAAFSQSHFMEYNWDKPGFEGEYRFPKKAFVTYYKPLGWYIATSVYKEDFEQKITNLTNTILLFSIFFIAIAFVISLLMSRSISNPLNMLVNTISTVDKDGLPTKPISPAKISEIKVLSATINTMIDSIRKSRKELKVERDYSMELINATPDIICGLNNEGITTFINPAGERVTGYSKEEIIGKNWWKLLYPDKVYKQVERIFNTFPEGKVIEIKLFRKNGEKRDIVWNSFTRRDHNNNILEIIGFGNDITNRKQIEKELIEAKEKAEESDRLKSAFLANMSHEIRTPMNGILGFINLLNEPNLNKSQIDKYSTIINKSSDRLLNTIDDIIDISRIEAGEVLVLNTKISIQAVMNELYTFHSPEAKLKGLSLSIQPSLSPEQTNIITDRNKFHRILSNLIKNAIKYTKRGAITFGYSWKNKCIEFFVKDTGIGIPKDRTQAIFNRFEQADNGNTRLFEGSGLGLALSKAYTEMLGGKIWVESKEGKGSVFYFTIPYKPELKDKDSLAKIDNDSKDENLINNLKILIAEDDEISGMLIEIELEKYCKTIIKARTGAEVVEICRNNPDIDLILMDIRMPIMDGYEATRQIRQFNKNIIIIAQTAYSFVGDREKSIESGCNDYISKPILKDKLFELIRLYFRK
ncbi:cache domain-containing protein [Ancylomarina euxinus]|nr:cache domain-containing protein [Ancylomarina euxinus]MCZ4695055.1 cache domain-containing protein [Ancylomarina euxinus]